MSTITEAEIEKTRRHVDAASRRMLDRLVRWLQWVFLGKDYCPRCERYTRWGVKMDNPVHPDGPPIFERMWCKECGLDSGWQFTEIMETAIVKHVNQISGGTSGEEGNG